MFDFTKGSCHIDPFVLLVGYSLILLAFRISSFVGEASILVLHMLGAFVDSYLEIPCHKHRYQRFDFRTCFIIGGPCHHNLLLNGLVLRNYCAAVFPSFNYYCIIQVIGIRQNYLPYRQNFNSDLDACGHLVDDFNYLVPYVGFLGSEVLRLHHHTCSYYYLVNFCFFDWRSSF